MNQSATVRGAANTSTSARVGRAAVHTGRGRDALHAMNTLVMNLLARRLGCTAMYPDWYVVRKLLIARTKLFVAALMRRPVFRAWFEPGRVLRGTLAGLPELRLFPDQGSRREALNDFGATMCQDRNWRWWVVVSLMIAFSAAAGFIASALVVWADTPVLAYGVGSYFLRAASMTLVFLLLLRKAQRVGAAGHMRILLIDRGVAVCLRCGYCLAGHDSIAARCPECGWMIDPATKEKMIRTTPQAAGDGADIAVELSDKLAA